MIKNLLLTIIVLAFGIVIQSNGQGVGINNAGSTPDPSAMLDVSSTSLGFIMPRLSTAQRNAISSPATGLMIYNTDCNNFNYYTGTGWQPLNSFGGNVPVTAGNISGTSNVCLGQSGVIYSVNTITSATSYVWTYSGTGFFIASGIGTNIISANFSGSATSGSLTVYGSNECGSGVSSNAYSVSISSNPLAPTTISGSSTPCQNGTSPYSISTVSGATTYTWTVPTGASVTSGQGTTSVNITFGSSSGDVCVTAGNSCGTSSSTCKAITVGTGWIYRKPVTITSSSAQINYQVKITVSYNTSMQSDFDDIRFTSSDGVTLLDYWRESYTASSSAVFWVEVPSVASGSTTIYMYYGNSSISTSSNGANTFIYFDNFETSTWSYTENITPFTGTWSTANYTSPTHSYLIEFPNLTPSSSGKYGRYSKTINIGTGTRKMQVKTYDYRGVSDPSNYWYKQLYVGSTSYYSEDATSDAAYTWDMHEWTVTETGSQTVYFQLYENTGVSNYGMYIYWDDLLVRNYTSPEPTYSFGSEESTCLQ